MAEYTQTKHPSWWSDAHSTSWERAKEALRRDWEQTKADFGSGGQELNQGVGDTVRQATGKEPLPPTGFANPPEHRSSSRGSAWSDVEPGIRYGYGARQYYSDRDWNDDLEAELRRDWTSQHGENSWDKMKGAVRRGWDSVRRAL